LGKQSKQHLRSLWTEDQTSFDGPLHEIIRTVMKVPGERNQTANGLLGEVLSTSLKVLLDRFQNQQIMAFGENPGGQVTEIRTDGP
jgi:hypothetical protein